jgi:hypothetical protein
LADDIARSEGAYALWLAEKSRDRDRLSGPAALFSLSGARQGEPRRAFRQRMFPLGSRFRITTPHPSASGVLFGRNDGGLVFACSCGRGLFQWSTQWSTQMNLKADCVQLPSSQLMRLLGRFRMSDLCVDGFQCRVQCGDFAHQLRHVVIQELEGSESDRALDGRRARIARPFSRSSEGG